MAADGRRDEVVDHLRGRRARFRKIETQSRPQIREARLRTRRSIGESVEKGDGMRARALEGQSCFVGSRHDCRALRWLPT